MKGKGAKPALRHVEDLTLDPKNRRKRTPRSRDLIVRSLKHNGAARSIVIDEHNVILAGNGVVDAAAEAGIRKLRVVDASGDEIIAVRRRGLTEEQKLDLAISDNRTAELSEWDIEQLKADQLDGLDLSPFFFEKELQALTVSTPKAGKTDPDEVPEPRRTDIKTGDLFELGAHRLLCGDSTEPSNVERLMQGSRAGLMNTDPPYGIAFDNAALGPTRKKYSAIKNDQLHDSSLQRFLEAAFRAAVQCALAENAAWYLWHAHLTQGFFAAAAAAAANVVLHRQIVWVKPRLILGRGHFHWKHEPCFMGWVDKHQPPDYGLGNGERTQTTVWELDGVSKSDRDEFQHATPKPVTLFQIPIMKHLRASEWAYEPFAGSGPQIIAAEQCGMRCAATEIDPSYCQVIIDRWEAFTGQKAKKVGDDRPRLRKRSA